MRRDSHCLLCGIISSRSFFEMLFEPFSGLLQLIVKGQRGVMK